MNLGEHLRLFDGDDLTNAHTGVNAKLKRMQPAQDS
jgi:hypothetical protein